MGLGRFEGDEVLGVKVKITKAGDGLSEALAIEPRVLKQRSTVYVVLECAVGRVSFDPVKDASKGLNRIQTLIASTATIVDEPELVKGLIEDQRLKNEAARGESSLNFGEGDAPTADGGWDDDDKSK